MPPWKITNTTSYEGKPYLMLRPVWASASWWHDRFPFFVHPYNNPSTRSGQEQRQYNVVREESSALCLSIVTLRLEAWGENRGWSVGLQRWGTILPRSMVTSSCFLSVGDDNNCFLSYVFLRILDSPAKSSARLLTLEVEKKCDTDILHCAMFFSASACPGQSCLSFRPIASWIDG
jgi:hypothetical protein